MSQPPGLGLNKASAAVGLTPGAREVHRHILATMAETGEAPSHTELERFARDHGLDPAPVLTELTERDVVAVDVRGELRAAYPFSPHPTAITVTWAGGPTVFAMCAIDALGMSAMLDRPVIITATEPGSGEIVIVEVDHDRAGWTPETAVVFGGSTDDPCCPSVDRSCGNINFFTTADAARTWAIGHPDVSGHVLDQATALRKGIAEFGELLH